MVNAEQDDSRLETLLTRVVGAVHTSFADSDRGAYGDLAPDVVVWPGSSDEVVEVLAAARQSAARVAVTGAGTRAKHRWPRPDARPRLALDTQRLNNILRVDETSLLVQSQCGIQLRFLEEALQREGMTLGPLPASMRTSTLGGVLADPPPLAASPLSGTFIDSCIGVTVATAAGGLLETRVSPRSATGPDVAKLYLASSGALGVITDAVLRVQREPEAELCRLISFEGRDEALKAASALLAAGLRPARLTVHMEAVAVSGLAGEPSGHQAILATELQGPEALIGTWASQLDGLCRPFGGGELPQQLADGYAREHLDPVPRSAPRSQAFLPFSAASEALSRLDGVLEEVLPGVPILRVCDQFTAQGANLWLGWTEAEIAGEAERLEANLRLAAALTSAGLAPRRRRHTGPLAENLRRTLDPDRVLLSPRWH